MSTNVQNLTISTCIRNMCYMFCPLYQPPSFVELFSIVISDLLAWLWCIVKITVMVLFFVIHKRQSSTHPSEIQIWMNQHVFSCWAKTLLAALVYSSLGSQLLLMFCLAKFFCQRVAWVPITTCRISVTSFHFSEQVVTICSCCVCLVVLSVWLISTVHL